MSDVTGAVIEVIVKESAKRLFSLLESALLTSALRKEVLEAKVEFHLRYVLSWASQVQHYGMAESKDVEDATIGLSLAAGARRFRPRSQTPDVLTEESLLADG